MALTSRRWPLAFAALVAAIAAVSASWYRTSVPPLDRETPPHVEDSGPRLERAGLEAGASDSIRQRLERLSEQEMKRFYVGCSQADTERRLDSGGVMACSIGYDVLLKKHFAGDFDQLLSWSRAAPNSGPHQ